VSASSTAAATSPRRNRRTARRLTFLITLCSAVAFVSAYHPPRPLEHAPFVVDSAFGTLAADVEPARDAYGRSGAVWMRTALPGQAVDYPVELRGPTTGVRYSWETVPDLVSTDSTHLLDGGRLIAPTTPGFYQLVIHRDSARVTVPGPTLAVLVPFSEKERGVLRGYRIGTYLAERVRGKTPPPEGFLEIRPADVDLPITKHLHVGDFLNHDQQGVWPSYAAVNPKLLDKLELILADVGGASRPELEIDVHSGFRSPDHNREVRRAASDSRHQYGDAADIQIDANGDGKITMTDEIRVMLAVERVEDAHPDLVGGLGIYTSRRYRTPYLHIDTRGKRSRWRG